MEISIADQKVFLVTGSSRGIGAELVRRFAQQGHRVVINYARSEEEASRLHTEIVDTHGRDRALIVKADVSTRSEVVRLFEETAAALGCADVLVNNAGLNIDGPFLEMTDQQWHTVVSTILTGTFLCSQEFARRFRGKEGHIVNIGALTAFRGRKNGANYCSARAGVIALSKCLAQELAPRRIRVNCVVPGWINTEEVMERYELRRPENLQRALDTVPLRRLGTPADVFTMIDFIVNHSEYITGHTFFVDGGYLMY